MRVLADVLAADQPKHLDLTGHDMLRGEAKLDMGTPEIHGPKDIHLLTPAERAVYFIENIGIIRGSSFIRRSQDSNVGVWRAFRRCNDSSDGSERGSKMNRCIICEARWRNLRGRKGRRNPAFFCAGEARRFSAGKPTRPRPATSLAGQRWRPPSSRTLRALFRFASVFMARRCSIRACAFWCSRGVVGWRRSP